MSSVAIFYTPLADGKENDDVLEPDVSVSAWVENGLANALRQEGFRVSRAKSVSQASNQIVVTVTTEEARIESYLIDTNKVLGEARILLHLEVHKPGEIIARNYSGFASKILGMKKLSFWEGRRLPPGGLGLRIDYGSLLTDAFNNLLRDAVPDLTAAIASAHPPNSPSPCLHLAK